MLPDFGSGSKDWALNHSAWSSKFGCFLLAASSSMTATGNRHIQHRSKAKFVHPPPTGGSERQRRRIRRIRQIKICTRTALLTCPFGQSSPPAEWLAPHHSERCCILLHPRVNGLALPDFDYFVWLYNKITWLLNAGKGWRKKVEHTHTHVGWKGLFASFCHRGDYLCCSRLHSLQSHLSPRLGAVVLVFWHTRL